MGVTRAFSLLLILAAVLSVPAATVAAREDRAGPPKGPLRVDTPPVSADKSVRYDYDIVYVRAPRFVAGPDGKDRPADVWPDASGPGNLRAPTDLMLLHPDGTEEVLVEGGRGAVADPYVSFDARWVYYTRFHDVAHPEAGGADAYKVNVKTCKTVRLTRQRWTPNTGVADWSADFHTPAPGKTTLAEGVYNMHPCPLPGGRVAFVSNRDGFKSPRQAQRALQLFVMDDASDDASDEDGAERNVEKIGHMNVAEALHPVILTDGRIIFSSLEVQGTHNVGWGILGIHPDGTGWQPIVSALGLGGAAIPFHFETQLSDGSIVVENYYIPAMGGFGVYFKLPPGPPAGTPAFGPAKVAADDPAMAMMRSTFRQPFKPYGMEVLTRFTHNHDSPALRADPNDPDSPHAGWVTQPCGAPDNHLLTVWSGMMPAHRGRIVDPKQPPVDSGIYLIKGGRPLWEPGEGMLLVKNDPRYNEQWPRPLVPYKRVYGVDEPRRLPALANDGTLSPHLPAGTPFGLVGTSSLYKRESYPNGGVPDGSVTATGAPYSAFPTREHRTNWDGQGADAGLYSNGDIHAIRILAMEPASVPVAGRFSNRAGERLRVLGEIPVRKFDADGKQPLDPDGNPDTSFLARVPADVAWTFQTLDKDGMVLNMAQTWHQVRPGEVRNNCGGCHAHSQRPTPFEATAAARPDYPVFDLTASTPLLTTKANDQSGRKWDETGETGLRYSKGVLNVEYHRDIEPIFARSCVACHTGKSPKPAGGLVLDDVTTSADRGSGPGTYRRLVHPEGSKATRFVWPFQSRTSVLAWKVFGRRTDGFPDNMVPGAESDYSGHIARGGDPYKPFKGSIMPPSEAVDGTYEAPDGGKIKVAPLTDEDRRTIVRWIDLGCPIDFDYDPKEPAKHGRGWMLDDQRPTLTVASPKAGAHGPVTRLLVGMYDYGTGLDADSFRVTADFPVNDAAAGDDLAARFTTKGDGVWELALAKPLTELANGHLVVSVKDRQGNTSRIERTFSVGAMPAAPALAAPPARPAADADNWPRWRGPHNDGGNDRGTYPATWGAKAGVLWTADLPGKGCSTPIVWDRRIYLTAPAGGQDAVLAFDWAGKPLWQTKIGPERPGKNKNGSGSNPSAATDGRGVFVSFKSGNLAALDLDGAVRWRTNLWERFGGHDTLYWDAGTSPVLTEKDVVLAVLQHGGSYVAAFDKVTGKLHWKVARDYDTPTEGDHGYATPIVFRHGDREAILVWGGEHLTAHDAADGSVLWSCGGFNPKRQGNWPAVASPVIVGDVAVVPYGRGSTLTGVRLDSKAIGDVTATHVAWRRTDTGTFVPTPAAYKGRIYLLHDRGEVECVDPADGKTLWKGQLPKAGASYYSSPAIADGKLYAAREDGVVFVARVEGGPFEVLGQNDLGERTIACPVPIAGRLLLRGERSLVCVGPE